MATPPSVASPFTSGSSITSTAALTALIDDKFWYELYSRDDEWETFVE